MADFKEMRLPIEVTDKMIGGPMWNTRVFGVQSGDEGRIGLWAYPLHKWDISEAGRELKTAQDTKFIHMRARGQLYGFRALDPLDFTVYPGQGALIATATTDVYQLVKVYSVDGDTFVRPILKPIPGQCCILTDTGARVSGDPIDYTTGLVTLTGTSSILSVITSAYSWLGMFDVPVRFTEDWFQAGKDTGLLTWKNAHIKELRTINSSMGTPPTLVVNWDFGPTPIAFAPGAPSPSPAPGPSPTPSPAPGPAPSPAPAPTSPATALTVSPTSATGTTYNPQGFTLTANGTISTSVTVSFTSSDSTDILFGGVAEIIAPSTSTVATVVATRAGTRTITFTNDGGLTNPAPVTFTV